MDELIRERGRRYRLTHQAEIKAAYEYKYSHHPEYFLSRSRKYYWRHREEILEKRKKSYQAKKEELKMIRRVLITGMFRGVAVGLAPQTPEEKKRDVCAGCICYAEGDKCYQGEITPPPKKLCGKTVWKAVKNG